MNDYFERLCKEKDELDEKLTKLSSFLNSDKFKNVNSEQQNLLKLQSKAMDMYSSILGLRIVEISSHVCDGI